MKKIGLTDAKVDGIRQFGTMDPAANYVLRPGGYAVVTRSSGQIALVSTKGGFYLPGGGQENGETAEAAAVREALEECGASIRIIDRIGIADELLFAADERIHFRKRCTFFRADLLTEELTGGESDHTLLWTSASQAILLLRHDSQKWAVAENEAQGRSVMPQANAQWWSAAAGLVGSARVVIDRPAGTIHPRYPETVYPLNYGYLAGTNGGDGSGIDVWVGGSGSHEVCAAIVCVDRLKGEIETKLLLGCTEKEVEAICQFHSEGQQSALLLRPLPKPF